MSDKGHDRTPLARVSRRAEALLIGAPSIPFYEFVEQLFTFGYRE